MSSTKKSLKIALLGDGSTGKTTYFKKIQAYNDPDYKFPKKYIKKLYWFLISIK